jgi:hypothetical protein
VGVNVIQEFFRQLFGLESLEEEALRLRRKALEKERQKQREIQKWRDLVGRRVLWYPDWDSDFVEMYNESVVMEVSPGGLIKFSNKDRWRNHSDVVLVEVLPK